MQQGAIACEARGDVAARDTVDRAIDGGKQEKRVAGSLIPWRKDVCQMQQLVRAEGENDACERAASTAPTL